MEINQSDFHEQGFALAKQLVSLDVVDMIKQQISETGDQFPAHGIRHANKKFSTIADLCQSEPIVACVRQILGNEPNIVRVIVFNKTAEKNWGVPFHQDKTICVDKRVEVAGWRNWTIKDSEHHVQPSLDVLNNMVTVRLHLDKADSKNGCLKVIPGSHQLGVLSQNEIDAEVATDSSLFCEAQAGDVLLMRPHLLHASAKATEPVNRRVVHIEFCRYPLPANLNWL